MVQITTEHSNLIDIFFGTFIAFCNKRLLHLLRFYGILRLHLIYSDEKDIAVGDVELKLEKMFEEIE